MKIATPLFAACAGWSMKSLAKIVASAMLLLGANTLAQANAELYASLCSNCHNDSMHPRELVYNAAGNTAMIAAVNSLGMGAGGSGADYASIAAYLDTIKPAIRMAPVAHNSPGTVISLRDIKVSAAVANAHLKIIGRIETVSPPRKGTVTYDYALGFLTPSNVVYTPFPGQSGEDTWTYKGIAIDARTGLDTTVRTATVVIAAPAVAAMPNYTALWWNPAESGWGVNVNHQGDIAFATLFTYDASGNPMWLVMSNGARQSGDTFSGPLYRTTGPAFNAVPFMPIGAANVTTVGTMTLSFSGDTGTLSYSVNGITVNKSIQKQVFGVRAAACQPTTSDRSSLTNYQDLWWNAAESGWGVNITQQGNALFATLFTYNPAGQGLWLVMSAGGRQADGSYLGELYQTTGPAFNAQPFTPITAANVSPVGTMRFAFNDGISGTLAYTYNGTAVTKAITRQVFSSLVPACN